MSDLKIFAKTVEQEVHDQLKQLMSVDVFKNTKIRIMPDYTRAWTDEDLYRYFDLTPEEIRMIENEI